MDPLSHVVKVTLPNYLSGLPIPNSFGGWFKLGVRDWLSLVPFGAAVAGITYISYLAFCPIAKGHCSKKSSKPVVNPDIQKEDAKVVHSFDVEDIGEKAAFCRCWRSKKGGWFLCTSGCKTWQALLGEDNVLHAVQQTHKYLQNVLERTGFTVTHVW